VASREAIEEAIRNEFGESVVETSTFRDELTVRLAPEIIRDACRFLRDDPGMRFEQLIDLTAVDYLNLGRHPRFDVVYHLLSLEHNHRVRVKVAVGEEEPHVASVVEVWPGADWYERETYDLFGIVFDGHPNLTRIMMPDDWQGHPLRKDFPVGGSPSFYFKRDSTECAGEPPDLVPRIRSQNSDV
jgi:NADH-quinone oxidoreductase subunit C